MTYINSEVIFIEYQEFINNKGERLWLPILAGAAIITAPLWANNKQNNCCIPPQYYQPVPYPYIQANYVNGPYPGYYNPYLNQTPSNVPYYQIPPLAPNINNYYYKRR